jgi:hypothetical protein
MSEEISEQVPASSEVPASARGKLWTELKALDPYQVAARAAVSFDHGGREDGESIYTVRFLDRDFSVSLSREIVAAGAEGSGEDTGSDGNYDLLLLTYLVHACNTPIQHRWISEKDLPGGSLFFQGIHALPLNSLAERFGSDAPGFREACRRIGGKALSYGDASFSFLALPRVPLGLVLWEKDEEFPARVTALFDRSLPSHFPLDVVLSLVHCTVRRIMRVER